MYMKTHIFLYTYDEIPHNSRYTTFEISLEVVTKFSSASLVKVVTLRTSESEFWGSIPKSVTMEIFLNNFTETGGLNYTLNRRSRQKSAVNSWGSLDDFDKVKNRLTAF